MRISGTAWYTLVLTASLLSFLAEGVSVGTLMPQSSSSRSLVEINRRAGLRRLLGSDELAVLPEPLLDMAIGIGHSAVAIHFAMMELTDELATVVPCECPLSIEVEHALKPSDVLATIWKRQRALAIRVTIPKLPNISRPICPRFRSLTIVLVVFEPPNVL